MKKNKTTSGYGFYFNWCGILLIRFNHEYRCPPALNQLRKAIPDIFPSVHIPYNIQQYKPTTSEAQLNRNKDMASIGLDQKYQKGSEGN